MKNSFLLLLTLIHLSTTAMYECKLSTTFNRDTHTASVTLIVPASPENPLYKEYITLSTDNPALNLSEWTIETPAEDVFDPSFKETKKAYTCPIEIVCTLKGTDNVQPTHLIFMYYAASLQKMISSSFPLTYEQSIALETTIDIPTTQEVAEQESCTTSTTSTSFLTKLTDIASNSNSSLLIRLLVIFLIGLLMSLTPCIYPMMPITAGILQSQGSSSLLRNFLLATSYAIGIATTFSLLGLGAAFAGQAVGSLMTKPLFILPLIALITYLSLAMIGLYEMYIPSFMQPRSHAVKGGSFLSAFFFGLASGIVASPCLSPGLVALLCIVTTLGSKFLGFIMLFTFGIGLSMPLLIIGTFSGALNVLPQAGMWMVEVKKLFGYGMLLMCFYFLSYIVPFFIVLALLALFLLTTGIIFLAQAAHAHSKAWRLVKNTLGIFLIAACVVTAAKSYTSWRMQDIIPSFWHKSYQEARARAQQENKPLLLDIGAPFCSICKAIDASLFADATVQAALTTHTIPVKIDGSDSNNQALIDRYKVLGFPTILLINPTDGTVIKTWGPELYGTRAETFIQALKKLI